MRRSQQGSHCLLIFRVQYESLRHDLSRVDQSRKKLRFTSKFRFITRPYQRITWWQRLNQRISQVCLALLLYRLLANTRMTSRGCWILIWLMQSASHFYGTKHRNDEQALCSPSRLQVVVPDVVVSPVSVHVTQSIEDNADKFLDQTWGSECQKRILAAETPPVFVGWGIKTTIRG